MKVNEFIKDSFSLTELDEDFLANNLVGDIERAFGEFASDKVDSTSLGISKFLSNQENVKVLENTIDELGVDSFIKNGHFSLSFAVEEAQYTSILSELENGKEVLLCVIALRQLDENEEYPEEELESICSEIESNIRYIHNFEDIEDFIYEE